MPDFDYTKPFRQKNGRAAEFVCDGLCEPYTIAAKAVTESGEITIRTYSRGGVHDPFRGNSEYDLINIPEPQEEAMKLDFNRPITTRDGRNVRILCTDLNGQYPIAAHVEESIGHWVLKAYPLDGQRPGVNPGNALDLVNVPEKREVWVNIYDHPSDTGYGYVSKELADRAAGDSRIGRIRVPYTVGQFDE